MIKKLAVAAFIGAACLSYAGVASADDIPATPMNHGPMRMTGMGPAGDLFNLGMTPVNIVTPGVIQVGGAVTGAAPMAQPVAADEPAVRKHRRHHRHAKRHMSKKAM